RDAYDAGHVPGARHLARGQLELRVDKELPDPTARILTCCEFGKISTLAAATLRTMGYTRALALDGGMRAWREAGYPLERAAGEPAHQAGLARAQLADEADQLAAPGGAAERLTERLGLFRGMGRDLTCPHGSLAGAAPRGGPPPAGARGSRVARREGRSRGGPSRPAAPRPRRRPRRARTRRAPPRRRPRAPAPGGRRSRRRGRRPCRR